MADEYFDDPAANTSALAAIPLTSDEQSYNQAIIDSSGAEIYQSNGTTATAEVAASEGSAIAGIAAELGSDRASAIQAAAAQARVPGINLNQFLQGVTSGILQNSLQGALLQNPNGVTAQTISQILGQSVGSAAQSFQNTLTNPLHDYESYTYGLSLHLLTEQQYNFMMENPGSTYIPQNVLVASAGKYSPTFKRNPYFNEDFFFENLTLNNTVNITTMNRNSNVFQINFTLVEPTGFTFINRLLDAVETVGGKNYLRQPYLIQIDFYGYKDGRIASSGPIPGQSKYIPITFVSMKSRVTTKGAEYSIEAVPYNHQALNSVHIVTPAAFQIKAKTVQDLLGTGNVSGDLVNIFTAGQREAENIERLRASLAAGGLAPEDADQVRQYLVTATGVSGQFQVSGLTDGLNSWQKSLVTKNRATLIPNEYRVIFDDQIGKSQIFSKSEANSKDNTATGGSVNQTEKNNVKAAAGLPVGGIDWHSGVFNIKMGTPIDKVIDYAVRNSDYIKDQLADQNGYNNNDLSKIQLKLGNSLKWYRIVPSIKIKQYDPSRDQYAYIITYYVKVWTVNTKHPSAPQGRTPGWVKKYDYIYTGQNKDVLDCSIDFDMLYYVQLTAFKNKLRTSETGNDKEPSRIDTPDRGPNSYQTDKIQPIQINYVANNLKLQNRTGPQQANAVVGAELQRDLMVASKGDMISVQLKIVGDSQLIMQDDVLFGQNASNSYSQLTPNNSLYFTNGELYVFLNFQSPIDYNEETGLAVPGLGRYQYSEFSGIYKIITVESNFSRGKFEQTLDLVRLPISDQLRNQVTNARSRADTYVNYGLGQLTALPYSRFTGPRIIVNNLASGGILAAAGGAGGSLINSLASQAFNQVAGKIAESLKNTFITAPYTAATAAAAAQVTDEVNYSLNLATANAYAADTAAASAQIADEFNSSLTDWGADAGLTNYFEGGVDTAVGDLDFAAADWNSFGDLDFGGGFFT